MIENLRKKQDLYSTSAQPSDTLGLADNERNSLIISSIISDTQQHKDFQFRWPSDLLKIKAVTREVTAWNTY